MKRVKKILCLLLALVLVGGTILPNMKAKAENTGVNDKSTVSEFHVRFEGTLLEDTQETVYEPDEDGREISFTGYSLHDLKPYVTVFFNNGRAPMIYDEWYKIYQNMMNDFGEIPAFRTMQNQTPYTVGDDNTVKVTFLGYECETKVTVVYNPIREISVKATKPLYTNSDMITAYHEGNQELAYKMYGIYQTQPLITVVEKDGTEYQFSDTSALEEKYGYYASYTSDQSYTNHWTLKENEDKATFKAALNFIGKTIEFDVELQQNPIANIEAKYYGIIFEGLDVQPNIHKMEYEFTFLDGYKETFYCYNEVLGRTIAPVFTPQDTEEDGTWTAGTHYWTAQVCGIDIEIETEVKKLSEGPIKSISAVATKELVPDWHTDWKYVDGQQVYYLRETACFPEITLTYQDGSTAVMGYEQLRSTYPDAEIELSLDNESPEGYGKRTARLSVYGQECEFEVDVIEDPVERISAVATKPYLEHYTGEDYYIFMHGGGIVTVHYKDGTTFSGAWYELGCEFADYPYEEFTQNVVVGKNVKQVEFLGKTCDMEFEVIANPKWKKAVSIEAKFTGDLYEKKNAYSQTWYRYDHLIEVTLTFEDGTTLTGNLEEVNRKLSQISFDTVFTIDDQSSEAWTVGKYSTGVYYRGLKTEVEVEVKENPYTAAKISESEDGFIVELQPANASKETYKVKRYEPGSYNTMSWNLFGYFETEEGIILPVEAKFAGGMKHDYSNVEYMIISGVKSNSLKDCEWIESQVTTRQQGDVPEVTLNHSADELKELVITDADYQNKNVDGISAWLEVSEKTDDITDKEQQLLNQATGEMSGYKHGTVIDLSVYKQIPTEQREASTEKVSKLNNEISITIAVPEEILASTTNKSTIKMVRIHNGETQVLPCVYDEETKTITFKTDSFSTYAIAYEAPVSSPGGGAPGEAEPEGTTPGGTASGGATSSGTTQANTAEQSSKTENNKAQADTVKQAESSSPETGDHNTIVVYILLCVVSLVSLVVGKKKKLFF